LQGYKDALARNGITYDPSLVIMADLTGGNGEFELLNDAIDRMLSLSDRPTVLCCANDKMAMRVYGILRSRGISVPAEMSVAGYDDYRMISETLYPPLTTAELPYAAMGIRAGQLLLDMLRGEPSSSVPAKQLVGGRVCWRESVLVRDPAIIHLNQHIGGV
jgi:LacI family transcriptional regulator